METPDTERKRDECESLEPPQIPMPAHQPQDSRSPAGTPAGTLAGTPADTLAATSADTLAATSARAPAGTLARTPARKRPGAQNGKRKTLRFVPYQVMSDLIDGRPKQQIRREREAVKAQASKPARVREPARFTPYSRSLFEGDEQSEQQMRREREAAEAKVRLDELFEAQGKMVLLARTLALEGMLESYAGENREKGIVPSEDSLCSVCFGENTPVGPVGSVNLPCGHAFHIKCIAPWTAEHRNCPNCRNRL